MEIASIAGILAAIGVLIGLILTIMELRQLVAQRKMEMMVNIYPYFGIDCKDLMDSISLVRSTEFNGYDDFVKRYGNPNIFTSPVTRAYSDVANYMEGLGLLYKRRIVDVALVKDMYSYAIPNTWEKMKPLVLGMRAESGELRLFEYFEYLAMEMNGEGVKV